MAIDAQKDCTLTLLNQIKGMRHRMACKIAMTLTRFFSGRVLYRSRAMNPSMGGHRVPEGPMDTVCCDR